MSGASTFGLALKQLREQAGMTQEQLAQRVGMNRPHLALLETDEAVPKWPTVLALAKALGVDCTAFPDVAIALKKSPRAGAAKKSANRKGKAV